MACSVDICPQNILLYEQTGDFSELPLLCHYPVKVRFYMAHITLQENI